MSGALFPRAVGWVLVAAIWVSGCVPSGDPVPRNLVIVSLDTTRADHLSLYGYSRATSPVLDRLGQESSVFTGAFAQETNTNPSHASMFTGLDPHVHGNVANGDLLRSGVITLAEILREAGFRTGGFVSGYTLDSEVSGLDRGFETYDDEMPEEGRRRPGPLTLERALAWLRLLPPEDPYFLFFHLYDAHGPYAPTPDNRALFQSEDPGPRLPIIPDYQATHDPEGRPVVTLNAFVDRYDASIRTNDDQLGRLLEEVDLDETIVLVLADHGETLGERHWSVDHGGEVYEEQIRIPLVLYVPGRDGRIVEDPVETVDLLPTLLSILALPLPESPALRGEILPPARELQDGRRPKPVFASARAESRRYRDRGYSLQDGRRIHAIRERRWKLVRYPTPEDPPIEELYDLQTDPGEARPLSGESRIRERLGRRLDRWLARGEPVPDRSELTESQREILEALGYL